MQNISKLVSKEMFFLISVIIYAVFSKPTPKLIGLAEVLIVIFFILSLTINFSTIKLFYLNEKNYIFLLIVFFCITLIFANSNNIDILGGRNNQFIRDYIGLLFMFIPYVLLNFKHNNRNDVISMAMSLCIGGLILIYYRLFFQYGIHGGQLVYMSIDHDYIYNDSLILFSINFIIYYTILNIKGFLKVLFIIFFMITIYNLYFFSLSTGSKVFQIGFMYLGLILLIQFFLFKFINIFKSFKYVKYFITFVKNKKNSLFWLVLMIIFFTLYLTDTNIIDKILNSRDKEINYFLNWFNIENSTEIFFGKGIGSLFSIEYNDRLTLNMGFVHVFPLYLILKFGLVGCFIIFIYMNRIFYLNKITFNSFLKNFKLTKDNIIFHSSFITIIGSSMFYTNFKHLTFWLIMGLLCLEIKNSLKK